MKKKSNISSLKRYSKNKVSETKQQLAKKTSQISNQKKLLDLWGKIEVDDEAYK